MKLKSPVPKIKGQNIITTLSYGDPKFRNSYIAAGWTLRVHNGEDYVCSYKDRDNFGLPIYAAHDGFIQQAIWEGEMNTKGNGLYIESDAFQKDNKTLKIVSVYWHLAKIYVKIGDRVKQGQKVGTMGNSGMLGNPVWNAAITDIDLKNPFRLTHLHFGVYVYELKDGKWVVIPDHPEANNAANPSNWLEENWKQNAPLIEVLDDAEDMPALEWAVKIVIAKANDIIQKVKDFLSKIHGEN